MKALGTLLLVLLVPGGLVIAYWLWKQDRSDRVSAAWQADHERRSFGVGLDQSCWRWPVNKLRNEAGRFNAAQLRKRA